MKTVNIKGLEISALSLGTVQLGLSYGINNADGKPSQETANAILNAALEGGINTLDTAAAYGDNPALPCNCGARTQRHGLACVRGHCGNADFPDL